MVNHCVVSNNQIKDILSYIKGMRHSEMIRMMFFCSMNGMRSINFAYLQIKDIYNPDGSVKSIIELGADKNKGDFRAEVYTSSQCRKEFSDYYTYMKSKLGEKLTPDSYLFTSQKLNKPFNRVSISRIFHNIYHKFNISGASHLGRVRYVTKLAESGVSAFLVQKLVNHKNISTTQRYYTSNPQKLLNVTELARI